jgi:hypothetical protein
MTRNKPPVFYLAGERRMMLTCLNPGSLGPRELERDAQQAARDAAAQLGRVVRYIPNLKERLFDKVTNTPRTVVQNRHKVISTFSVRVVEAMVEIYGPDCVKKTLTQARAELADSIWPRTSAEGVDAVDEMLGFTKRNGID